MSITIQINSPLLQVASVVYKMILEYRMRYYINCGLCNLSTLKLSGQLRQLENRRPCTGMLLIRWGGYVLTYGI